MSAYRLNIVAVFLLLLPDISFAVKKEQPLPDSIRRKCDSILIEDMGGELFSKCVSFKSYEATHRDFADSSSVSGTIRRYDYLIRYSFVFPGKEKADFDLGFVCAAWGDSLRIQSERFLRRNRTDLPEGFAQRGTNIITHAEAKKVACETDSLINAKKRRVEGDLVLTDDGVFWIFTASYSIGNPGGDNGINDRMEQEIRHVVWIDPYSGKVSAHHAEIH